MWFWHLDPTIAGAPHIWEDANLPEVDDSINEGEARFIAVAALGGVALVFGLIKFYF
jgi:hypothetical protein